MKLGVILAIGESLEDLANKGQVARMVDYNIKNYCKNFDEVYIFSYANEKWQLPKNCHLVINKYKIPRFFYVFLMPLLHLNEFRESDILRCFQLTGAIPAILAKVFFAKKIVFNYGYEPEKYAKIEGKYLRALLYVPLTIIVSFFSDAIFTTTSGLARNLPSLAKSKITIIPNGVDTNLFKPKNIWSKTDNYKILFVGRLEPEKNLKNLILALQSIKNVTLTIIGTGSQEAFLKSLAKELRLKINFISKVEYYKLPKYFQNSHIFVLPSIAEGHAKVLLEAQSSGLACVVSDIPQLKDVVKNNVNGITTSTSVEGLSKTLNRLIKNKKFMQKLGQRARETVLEEYEVMSLIKKEISILKSI